MVKGREREEDKKDKMRSLVLSFGLSVNKLSKKRKLGEFGLVCLLYI